MNIKSIAVLAVLLSCFAAAGGVMLTDSDDSEAAMEFDLGTDTTTKNVSYSKTLNGPGLIGIESYTITGADWLTLTRVSGGELKATGTPTSTGTYNVKVTGPTLQGQNGGEWTWTINVVNTTTYTVTVYGQTGNVVGSATLPSGSTYKLPNQSDTARYIFNGYYSAPSGGSYVGTSGTVITINSDRNIYSQWTEIIHYRIVLDLNGYYFMPNPQLCVDKSTYERASGSAFSLSVFDYVVKEPNKVLNSDLEPANLTFYGWSTSPTGTPVSYDTFAVNGNVTFYAIWEAPEEEEDLTFLNGTNSVIGVAGDSYSYSPRANIASAVITYTTTVPWLTLNNGTLSGTFPEITTPQTYNVIITANTTNPIQTVTQSITFYVYPELTYINEPQTSMYMGQSYDFDLTTQLIGVNYSLSGVDWLVVHNGHIVGAAPMADDTYTVTFTITATHVSSGQTTHKEVSLRVNQVLEFTTIPTSSFVASQVDGSVQYESFIIDWLNGLFPSVTGAMEVDYVFSGSTVKFVFTGTDAQSLRWYVNGQLASEDWTFTKSFSNGYYEISCVAVNELGESDMFSVKISVEQGFMGLTLVDYMIIFTVMLALLFAVVVVKKKNKMKEM
ncbi:MAG TPA: hypothetical protein VJY42_05080 [Candidatus Methanomethylophilaceae archaeon]|nr:hypothetical protein [Candidatus Methanomethylophilaceae archaeon]